MKAQMSFIAILFFLASSIAWAQPHQHGRMGQTNQQNQAQDFGDDQEPWMSIPDLTDKQKEDIGKITASREKSMLKTHNQMGELEAKLRTLSTADNADMAAINKTIEEIGAIRISMHKEMAAQRQEIRKLLTDKQRTWFDLHGEMMAPRAPMPPHPMHHGKRGMHD